MEVSNPSLTKRPFQESHFSAVDDTHLFYRYWPAASEAAPRRAVVLFHRGHEHGGRIAHLVDELGMADTAFFAWDARGLGRSPGIRGDAEHFGTLVKDVDCFIRHISTAYGIAMQDIAVVAQSVGAVAVAAWVHDYAPTIACMVLASPAFKVKLYVPLARPALSLMQRLRGKFSVNSYVKPQYLTHDLARIDSYRTDPLINRPISVNVLLGLYETAERVIADAAAIQVPTQLLVSGADFVVHQQPQHRFMARLGSRIKETHVFDGFFHDTLGEKDRSRAILKARAFLLARFAARQALPDLQDADQHGSSRDAFDSLSRPPASFVMRGYWAMSRFWIQVGASLSDGLRLGVESGFDSGSTLDYVYRNQANGFTPLGRMIDRIYLDSIGWRGIRVRKQHLKHSINKAIMLLADDGEAVNIVDIAAGHGRYIMEALACSKDKVSGILLRDYSAQNVAAGTRLIAEKGLQDIARFVQADAFDADSLAALEPRPTVAVVSGLYELFPDNAMIRQSLLGLARAMNPGTLLIYTNQPWHPQQELIARSLTSHRQGQDWVMRCRSQAEMDQLVAAAGFQKIDQLSDQWGIFSVSIARKT